MITITRLFVIAILFLSLTSAIADTKNSSVISPGEYISSGDSGTLKVQRGASGQLLFEIESIGGNCHSCFVSGTIRNGLGYAASEVADGRDSNCRITFKQKGTEIQVSSTTPEACRAYCGARAGIEDIYKRAPALCTRSSQEHRRNEFLKLYRSRNYKDAFKTLEPLLSQCKEFVNWIEIDKIRNDLAITELHNGNPVACLETLAATTAASYPNEESLQEGLPPCDYYNYIDTAKASWFNKSLCEKARAAKQTGFSAGKSKSNK